MKLAMVGLGKMGANMSRRLAHAGHELVGVDHHADTLKTLKEEIGLHPASTLEEAVALLEKPRVVWLMIPAGDAVEQSLDTLAGLLEAGDIVVDGGNSNFRDTLRRAEVLAQKGVSLVDSGVSGGVWGLEEGYSLMVGGETAAVERLRPLFESLAPQPESGWGHVGPSGAGHFVKMVHNGIEYGLMEAYAEGFEILRSKPEYDLDLHQVAEIWRQSSVVRSWLLDLTARALAEDQDLTEVAAWVADSGEGRWTVFEAINQHVSAPVITLALLQRLASRQEARYADKLLAAMRNQFGGHAIKKAE